MKHYALKNSPIAFNGAAIKKLLPNTMEFPKIDILIRESVQNSFDALKPDADCLRFGFRHGVFKTKEFASQLDDMNETIMNLYSSNESEYIEVRDRNTKGLGGSTEFSENFEDWGDFIRLVFAVANEQTGFGKGGSWGYGKTNYYSLGNGIVIYYTQTLFESKIEQRLIIAMVEDTRKRDRMLYPQAKLGISYWGSDCIGDNNVLPCTNPDEIKTILNIFGLKPFEKDETGTSIIIPFVNCKNLYLASADSIIEKSKIPTYSEDMFEFIVKLTIQRWYFPRLLNEKSKQFLSFEYNGIPLTKDDIFPLFKEFQEIYNDTLKKPSYITLSQLALRGKETKVASYSSRLLRMDLIPNPYNLTAYQMIGASDNRRPNAAIGFRCRSLGMINRYDVDREFVDNVEDYEPLQFRVVGLRPLPDVVIYDPTNSKQQLTSLEEYIRKGEDPTHSIWTDNYARDFEGADSPYKLQIIQQMLVKLRHVFERKENRSERQLRRNLAISRKIGQLLLPDAGFGTSATGGGNGGNGGGRGGSAGSGGGQPKKEPISYKTPTRYNEGDKIHIIFPFVVSPPNEQFTLLLTPCVEDIGSISKWEEKCGLHFPVFIESFKIISINDKAPSGEVSLSGDGSMNTDGINIKTHLHNGKVVALTVTHTSELKKVEIELVFNQSTCKFKTNIDVIEGGYVE